MGLLSDDHQHTEITDTINKLLKQKASSASFESGVAALASAARDSGPEGEREAARALRKKFKYGEKLQIVAAFDILDVLIAQRSPLPTLYSDVKMLGSIETIGTQIAERRGIMSRQYSKSVVMLCGRYAQAWREFLQDQGLAQREGFRDLYDTCGAITGAWDRSGASNKGDDTLGPKRTRNGGSRESSPGQSPQIARRESRPVSQYNARRESRPVSQYNAPRENRPTSQYNDQYNDQYERPARSARPNSSRRGNRAFLNDSADSSVFGESAQPLADADRRYRIPTINMKKEEPKIKLLISDSLAASTNLNNCLIGLPEGRNAMLDKQATDAFVRARDIRRKVLRYLQLVTGGDYLGSLIHANDELVAALTMYDDRSWDETEPESESQSESESEDDDIYIDQGRAAQGRDRVISPTNPFADDFEL